MFYLDWYTPHVLVQLETSHKLSQEHVPPLHDMITYAIDGAAKEAITEARVTLLEEEEENKAKNCSKKGCGEEEKRGRRRRFRRKLHFLLFVAFHSNSR